jgi:mono/diheme cytochrome c family protein
MLTAMKKLLRRLALAFACLVVIFVVGVSARFYGFAPVARAAPSVKAPSTPEAVARGKYLAEHVTLCRSCHSQSDSRMPGQPVVAGREFAGRDFYEIHDAGFPGRIRAPNLTSDPTTGIGRFTDGELLRAMREGIGRDGRALFMMPWQKFAEALSDDDALAIIAYLRTLPPIVNDPGRTEIDFPLSMLARAEPHPLERPAPPMPSNPLERGRRLITLGNCDGCHSTHDKMHNPIAGHYLAGGDPFDMPGVIKAYAPNLTSDPATGLGAYSDDDLLRVIDEGKNRTGRLLYFMPFTELRGMTDDDKRALISALREVRPVANVVKAAEMAAK